MSFKTIDSFALQVDTLKGLVALPMGAIGSLSLQVDALRGRVAPDNSTLGAVSLALAGHKINTTLIPMPDNLPPLGKISHHKREYRE